MPLIQLVFQELLCAPHGGNGARINDVASAWLAVEQSKIHHQTRLTDSFEHRISVLLLAEDS